MAFIRSNRMTSKRDTKKRCLVCPIEAVQYFGQLLLENISTFSVDKTKNSNP